MTSDTFGYVILPGTEQSVTFPRNYQSCRIEADSDTIVKPNGVAGSETLIRGGRGVAFPFSMSSLSWVGATPRASGALRVEGIG